MKEETIERQLNEINVYKPQEEQKKSLALWEPVERKDSYNNELQFYSKDNAVVKGDIIEIISKEEKREGRMYTSGLVESTNAYKYGYFEFTIGISEGKGIFPAIWFMPMDGDTLPEIDLFEMIGSEPYNFYGVIHFEEEGVQDSDYFKQEVSIKDRYSVAIKWTEEAVTWYIDGEEIYSTVQGVPQEYMYIIINQAIGGDWPGNPNDDTVFPSLFKILSSRMEPIYKKGRN
jgi:beta-glucanase (GH16 family)